APCSLCALVCLPPHVFLSVLRLLFLFLLLLPPSPTLFPYTTLFRSADLSEFHTSLVLVLTESHALETDVLTEFTELDTPVSSARSEEHTSELQSRFDLVCRLLLEKKKQNRNQQKCTTLKSN